VTVSLILHGSETLVELNNNVSKIQVAEM